jgi:8-oxo-dGTP pyrophosphatase MutT (NUDIX family)
MHREDLLHKLQRYEPSEWADAEARRRMEAFVRAHPDCFERSLTCGHLTGAAWLLDRAGGRVLLTHHRKLDCWLQLGGHADGDGDLLTVALREAKEESGIESIAVVTEDIFDLDVHPIPAHGGEPAHYHYDVRFLLQVTGDEIYRVTAESMDLAWFSMDELATLEVDESVRRMYRKWLLLA